MICSRVSAMLRPYQQRAIDQLMAWFEKGNSGNPCLVLPTGSGKSWIIAALVKMALQNWPETRVLMLTHVAELIQQNAEKMRAIWPNAPMGIYAAGLRQRVLDEPITFASIQSVRNRANAIGHVDLVLIDECHLLNNSKQGGYRQLLDSLSAINPNLRVIGLTASPYRLGQGLLTEGDEALFSDILEPVLIDELISKGYLSRLKSKHTATQLDTAGVKKRGGDYVAKDLARAVDTDGTTQAAVAEIVSRGEGYKSWLIFCCGVEHSHHVAQALQAHGIKAQAVTGKTPKAERDEILRKFKHGELQAVTNCEILTTGFDHPDLDLIAMLRPTMSPGLYQQMVGRGTRLKSHTDHCLVLDFAGNIETHGPITNIRTPRAKGSGGDSQAPIKVCPDCDELVHLSVMQCPECGHVWEKPEPRDMHLRDDDIMGEAPSTMPVTSWTWRVHKSKASGKEMAKVCYYKDLGSAALKEYLCLLHPGFAGQKAAQTLHSIMAGAGEQLEPSSTLAEVCEQMNKTTPPSEIHYRKDGKFHRVLRREWKT